MKKTPGLGPVERRFVDTILNVCNSRKRRWRRLARSLTLVGLVAAMGSAALPGCSDDSGSADNFRGTVTLNGDPAPNVRLEIVSESGSRLRRITDADGVYTAFLATDPLSESDTASFEVSITGEGLPASATCTPSSPQSVEVNADGVVEPSTLNFECTSPDNGMNGEGGTGGDAGGSGATGGTGGQVTESPFGGCTEQPPGSLACDCDPLNDNCSANLNCSLSLDADPEDNRVVTGVFALDGSDGTPATECLADFIQTIEAGGACVLVQAGVFGRRDECLPGLVCDPESNDTCVPLCLNNGDCADNSCEFYGLNDPDFGRLGRCSSP
ncbi:MAG: hypothetical protein AAGF92_01430 [Myxococcota bacterium]